jgi:D-sedoheptulose 7-phosphate isomerase
MKKTFTEKYLEETSKVIKNIDKKKIENLVSKILEIKNKSGRIFFLGVGGSAGNTSHAVNDFRKILNIECYSPTDNVSEITANTNDNGWDSIFINFLKVSRLTKNDLLFIFSVGGGNEEFNVSTNLIKAIEYAKKQKTSVVGIVGKKEGYTFKNADIAIFIPNINNSRITPHSEEAQGIVWHLVVSHPKLKPNKTKWESLRNK